MPTCSEEATADIPVVILAGGKGTRLRSVVSDRPKVLAEIHGRPYLTYLLDQVAQAGFSRVILSTGYMAEKVEAALGRGYRGLRLDYSREETPLGTGGGALLAMRAFPAPLFLVMNGDSYCDTDLAAYVAWFRRCRCHASLALARVADTSRYGRVETDGAGRVTSFVEKGGSSGPGLINVGQYLLAPEAMEHAPGAAFSLETELFQRLVRTGLFGYSSRGAFIDIGTIESYARADSFFAHRNESSI